MERVLKDPVDSTVDQVVRAAGNLQRLGEMLAKDEDVVAAGRPIPHSELEQGRSLELGRLTAGLDILEGSVVAPEKLEGVIQQLSRIKYRHAALWTTIEELEKRKGTPVAAAP